MKLIEGFVFHLCVRVYTCLNSVKAENVAEFILFQDSELVLHTEEVIR